MSFIQHKGLVALFLFLLSFGAFTFSFKNDFVWDDFLLKKNIYSFKVSRIPSMVIPEDKKEKSPYYYRPVVDISLVVDQGIWGVSPFGFHLSNVIFHSVSTVLFYFLALLLLGEFRIERKEATAFLSSLLFALYPMHVESVSFIGARADLLCSLFFFLAFIFYILSYRKLWFVILAAVCFYFSLLSKEVAVAFPIVALGFDLISRRFANRNNILKYSVCGVLILVYFYLRGRAFINIPEISGERVQQSTHMGYQIWGVLKVLLSSYLFYIKKLVFPFNLNPFIATVPMGFYYLVSSILVILLLCVIGFISIRKREGITAFSIFWILTTLGPPSLVAIFGVASMPLAERFLYIPSAGYCMLMGYFLLEAGKRIKAQRIGWAFGFLLCISYLFFTIEGQSVWKDNLSLWEYASKRSPYDVIPHVNYAVALNHARKTDQAIREFLIALNPGVRGTKREKADIANRLGLIYMDKEDYRNAEEWFLKALYYDPTYRAAYYHLGLIYFIKGQHGNSVSDYRMAENYLKKALEISPAFREARLLLSMVYSLLGEEEKAIERTKKSKESTGYLEDR